MIFMSLLSYQRKLRVRVMKSMCIWLFVFMFSGCETFKIANDFKDSYKNVEEGTIAQEKPKCISKIRVEENIDQKYIPTLYDLTNSSNEIRPEKLMVYRHTVGRIKIFQVIKEKGKDANDVEITWVLARGEDMVVGIINDRGYVNGEYVQGGEYRYIGPLTYETAPIVDGVERKGMNTVRLFVEVDCEFDKLMQKQKMQSEQNIE